MEKVVEKARTYLDAHRGERVTLERLAGAVGASPFHLQRRFKVTFGVSPRDYQDAHRIEAVKSSLKNGSRVTDALYEAGYGSVSRFLRKVAPRHERARLPSQREGSAHRLSTFKTSLGTVLIAATEKGLCSVKLGDDPIRLRRLLTEEFSQADVRETDLPDLREKILSFIEGEGSLARLPLDIRGTVFQRRVWDELRRIPRRDAQLSRHRAPSARLPRCARLAARAANPVALVVPCHRAVRTDGGLGGYAWGFPGRAPRAREG